MHKVATIKDVAELANVSVATVSRVLNGNTRVNNMLCENVKNAMEKLQYSPNQIARSLQSSSSKEIGFIVSNMDDQYFTDISRGIERVITPHGYCLIVCNTYFDPKREREFLRLFRERRISGIVINTTGDNDADITAVSHIIPTVLCSRKINDPAFLGDFVDFDSYASMYQLTEYLISLGHRKISIINGPRKFSTANERFLGFRDAMMNAGTDIFRDYPYIPEDCEQFSEEFGYKRARDILESSTRPTAIIATNGATAVGAIRYFREHSIAVPDDVSFCCFDNIVNSNLFYLQPTFMSTNRQSMGNQIGSIIIERIKNMRGITNREIRLSTILVEHQSVKRLS